MSTPESALEVALLAEAPKQWARFQARKAKVEKGKPKWQRELDEFKDNMAGVETRTEELLRQYDPELMRITSNFDRKMGTFAGGLRCPKCGEPDRGNRMNDKPWCIQCNIPLESSSLQKKRFPIVKAIPKSGRLNITFAPLDGGNK